MGCNMGCMAHSGAWKAGNKEHTGTGLRPWAHSRLTWGAAAPQHKGGDEEHTAYGEGHGISCSTGTGTGEPVPGPPDPVVRTVW